MPARQLLSDDHRKIGIAKAAWQLEDAMNGRLTVDKYPADLNARATHFEAEEAYRHHSRALLALVFLTIFETPSWCDTENDFFTYVGPSQRCRVEGVKEDNLLLSNVPYIPPGWSVLIELVAIFYIARSFLIQRKLQVLYFDPLNVTYNNLFLINTGLVMVVLEIIDCVVFVLFRPSFRIAFVARTGFLCMVSAVMNLCGCLYKILGEVVTIAFFYLMALLFFSWIAVEVFSNVEGEVNGKPINVGLDTFGSSLNSLFVAGSTADFVGVFLPSYTAYRAFGILWCVFLIIVKVLLLSLVLDTLVSAYIHFNEEEVETVCRLKVDRIRQAFNTLAEAGRDEGVVENGEPGISEDMFVDFMHELRLSQGTRTLTEQEAIVVFKAVDKDKTKVISRREFCDICGVLEYDFWITPQSSWLEKYLEDNYLGEWPPAWATAPLWARSYLWFRQQHTDLEFDKFMNYVLLLNLILVVLESAYDLNGWEEPGWMDNLELTFSLVYVVEVGLNLTVLHWKEYWSQRSYQFDFVVTWLLLFSSILDEVVTSGFGGDLKRYINILRLLRLLRVMKKIVKNRKVQLMVEATYTIVCASKDILCLLSVVVLFYSALGVQMWGGLLYEGNEALEETEYDEKDWYILNFQDVPMALGVWVVSLLSEYVQDFPEALHRVSAYPVLSKFIFISFYVFSVCIIFELVKAFTVEVFINVKRMQKGSAESDEMRSVSQFATFEDVKDEFCKNGESLHYRPVGDPMFQEKMTEALEQMNEELKAAEEAQEEAHRHAGAGSSHDNSPKESRQYENPQDVAS